MPKVIISALGIAIVDSEHDQVHLVENLKWDFRSYTLMEDIDLSHDEVIKALQDYVNSLKKESE